ncbi:unnamed protein product [Cutaneotrichosporon oleaginosum]
MEWEPNGAPIDTSPSTSSFHSPVNGSNGTAAAAAGPAANGATLFISLDTNVLIDQLSVVSEVHARLISAGSTTYLLVGQQAVNELDGLSKSTRSDLAAAAREATLWLDTTIRGPRVGRASRLRIESRAERIAAALDTHEGVGIQAREDDAILSCCIWFGRAAPVLLWTHDRNLAVLAEGSAVRTLVGRAGALRLLREAGVALDADEGMELDVEIMDADEDLLTTERALRNADRVAELIPHHEQRFPQEQHAYTAWVPQSVPASTSTTVALQTALKSLPRRRSSSSIPTCFPHNISAPKRHSAASTPRGPESVVPPPGELARAITQLRSENITCAHPSRIPIHLPTSHDPAHASLPRSSPPRPPRIPPDLEALLVATLAPVSALLEAEAASDAISHARAIAARLDDLDSPDKPVDLRRALVRAFAHARKFAAYLAGDPERVRAGEAANALLIVAQELGRLMPLDKNAWAAAAAQVRQLP